MFRLNPLQSEAVVFTELFDQSSLRARASLNPLQSEAVVFTGDDFTTQLNIIPGLNPLQSEAVVFTHGIMHRVYHSIDKS